MFQVYQPSGRFSPSFVLWLLIGLVLIVGAAYLYQLGLFWIPFIYVSFLLTLGMGFLTGSIAAWVINMGKVRSVPLGTLCFLILALTGTAAGFGFQYWSALKEVKHQIFQLGDQAFQLDDGTQLTPEEIQQFRDLSLKQFSILTYLQDRLDRGWMLGQIPIKGVFVLLVWLIEAGIILYTGFGIAKAAAKQPYSEKLDTWASESETVMTLPVTNGEMLKKIRSAKSVQELLEIPIPDTDQSTCFASYTVNSVPGAEMEDAYLSVDVLNYTTNNEGELKILKEPLVSLAILTSEQRNQLKENAEIMAEAICDFAASKQEASEAKDKTEE